MVTSLFLISSDRNLTGLKLRVLVFPQALKSQPTDSDAFDFNFLARPYRLQLVAQALVELLKVPRVFSIREFVQVPDKQPVFKSVPSTVRLASRRPGTGRFQ